MLKESDFEQIEERVMAEAPTGPEAWVETRDWEEEAIRRVLDTISHGAAMYVLSKGPDSLQETFKRVMAGGIAFGYEAHKSEFVKALKEVSEQLGEEDEEEWPKEGEDDLD
jgi:DNA-binding NarL/FixJ family response regulator